MQQTLGGVQLPQTLGRRLARPRAVEFQEQDEDEDDDDEESMSMSIRADEDSGVNFFGLRVELTHF